MALVLFSGHRVFSQQKEQTIVSLNVGAGVPVGDFTQSALTGYGGTFDVRHFILKRFALGGQIGFFSFGGKALAGESATDEYNHQLLPVMANVSYYFGDEVFLVGLGTGIGFCRFETNKTIDFESISTAGTKSCIAPHVHCLIRITPRIGISAVGSYYAVFGSLIDIGFFGVTGGVAYKF